MSFTDEKIKVLSSLLRQYEFSDGFTFYDIKDEISDAGYYSKHYISISGPDPFTKKTLSGEGNFALFPIVFDYFDAVLDKKLSVSSIAFSSKKLMFLDSNRSDEVIDFLENEVLSKAVELRNKIIHNELTISEGSGEILLPSGQKYQIADFGLLNRLVFNVAFKCANDKDYSLYEKSAALSLYKKVFGSSPSDVINSLYKKERLVEMVVFARSYRDFSRKTISPTAPLYDILSENIKFESEESGKTEFKKGICSNRTFQFRVYDTDIVIPAELVDSNSNITLQDIGDWCV
jgi:hypothetical protein